MSSGERGSCTPPYLANGKENLQGKQKLESWLYFWWGISRMFLISSCVEMLLVRVRTRVGHANENTSTRDCLYLVRCLITLPNR
jgi:hypothetical protein